MTTRILVDGKPSESVAAEDRGLMYGDGVFRTLILRDGQPRWWDAHLAKLAQDCDRLGLQSVPDDIWRNDLHALDIPEGESVLKLVVTRGAGIRGYRPSPAMSCTRLAIVTPAPKPVSQGDQVRVRICRLRLGHQPVLAGVKHLNRLENVLAQAEWDDPEIAEGLLLDQDGHLVGGTKTNVFIVRGGRLVTPALSRCGVAGVARARLMAIAQSAGIEVELNDGLWLDDVMRAEEILLCNSVVGLWRVGRLEDRTWETPVLYPMLAERMNG